jgi:hypothetical protein
MTAAPEAGVGEGYVESVVLALHVNGALAAPTELEIDIDDGVARCDQIVEALFVLYGRGLVERSGSKWRLSNAGRSFVKEAGVRPSDEASAIIDEALATPAEELMPRIAEALSSRYAMMAAANGESVRV